MKFQFQNIAKNNFTSNGELNLFIFIKTGYSEV